MFHFEHFLITEERLVNRPAHPPSRPHTATQEPVNGPARNCVLGEFYGKLSSPINFRYERTLPPPLCQSLHALREGGGCVSCDIAVLRVLTAYQVLNLSQYN